LVAAGDHTGGVRIFVAVPVPADVADVLSGLERPTVEGLRWTMPEQWHVTMVFLGEVPEPAPVLEALRLVPGVLAEEYDAELGPVTAWFSGRRVLHVPVRGVEPLAAAVAHGLEGDSAAAIVSDEARPFVGHLTLARMRGARPGPGRLAGIPVHASWPVESMALMGSTLGPGGARYETLESVLLRPSAGADGEP
jgi:2'-5' RNA ligase